jgi:hypothetical protein
MAWKRRAFRRRFTKILAARAGEKTMRPHDARPMHPRVQYARLLAL